jgi:NitT/TauT family transport system substrate-binding protein
MKIFSPLFFFLAVGFAISASAADLHLALNWKAEPQFGGFYAALSSLQKNHLPVKIMEGGSGTPTVQMLAAGQVEYAIVSADEVIVAADRGASDIVALFATYQTNPAGIMTHGERKFSSLEQVFHSPGVLLWQEGLPYALFLKKKYAPLQVQTAPDAGGIGPFLKDAKISQQCFVTSEPLAAEKAKVKVKTFLVSDSGYNPYTTVLVTKKSRLKSHPQEVRQIVLAVREGWKSYLQDPSMVNATMMKLNPAMDAETFAQSAQAQKPLIAPAGMEKKGLGRMTAERWQTLAEQLYSLHLTKKKIETKDLFENL